MPDSNSSETTVKSICAVNCNFASSDQVSSAAAYLTYKRPTFWQPQENLSDREVEGKFISSLVSPSPEWHLRSLPGSQHDPRPRPVSPFPRHLFLWTCPACQQGSLTKAGVKRGLVVPGGSISGIHPAGEAEEEVLMHRGSLPSASLLANPTEKASDGKDARLANAIDLTDCQCTIIHRSTTRTDLTVHKCTLPAIRCNRHEESISLIANAILQTEKMDNHPMQSATRTNLPAKTIPLRRLQSQRNIDNENNALTFLWFQTECNPY